MAAPAGALKAWKSREFIDENDNLAWTRVCALRRRVNKVFQEGVTAEVLFQAAKDDAADIMKIANKLPDCYQDFKLKMIQALLLCNIETFTSPIGMKAIRNLFLKHACLERKSSSIGLVQLPEVETLTVESPAKMCEDFFRKKIASEIGQRLALFGKCRLYQLKDHREELIVLGNELIKVIGTEEANKIHNDDGLKQSFYPKEGAGLPGEYIGIDRIFRRQFVWVDLILWFIDQNYW